MNFIHVLILSFIEGVTEFLPISSTGHMILASKLLGIIDSDFTKTFEIVIQLGAIMAVVVLYYKKFLVSFDIYKKLFWSFLPTAIVGFTLYPIIKNVLLGSTNITVAALFIGGVILLFFERYFKIKKHELTTKNYLLIGLAQSLSVIPGVSRAAATIVGGMFNGMDRKEATEFSFLLAIPTMMAATALDLFKSRHILASQNITMLGVGTILSFVVALFAVKYFLKYVESHDFKIFGVYRIILAILFFFLVN